MNRINEIKERCSTAIEKKFLNQNWINTSHYADDVGYLLDQITEAKARERQARILLVRNCQNKQSVEGGIPYCVETQCGCDGCECILGSSVKEANQ